STALGQTFTGISCATTTTCVAVTSDGSSLTTTNGGTTWGPPVHVTTGLTGISCATATSCYATSTAAPGKVFDTESGGAAWGLAFDLATDPAAGFTGAFSAIDCTITTCYAVGAGGLVAAETGGVWRTDNPVTQANLTAISCPSADSCFATADDSTVLHGTDFGGAWEVQFGGAP